MPVDQFGPNDVTIVNDDTAAEGELTAASDVTIDNG